MAISPFEERYATEMNRIFDEKNKLRKWILVEVALAKAHAELGTIPKDASEQIEKASSKVKLERVKAIEAEIHHDLMAMVRALSEQAGDAGKYIHIGATSYDIEDTATALMFREALDLIEKRLEKLCETLKKLAKKHKKTVCIGRTHGQHALPTTYGMKFALYYNEAQRHLQRLKQLQERVSVGKMSGAVGTMAGFQGKGKKLQELVMKELDLQSAVITNQIIQRDRYAEVLAYLALIAGSIEKIAKELRNMQRNEILEVAESFGKKQVGSSTMPHKRNPHKSERLCSLARVVRAYASVAMENIALEHERDLTNSANERVIFPGGFICVDYMLTQVATVLENLEFFPENIKRNLELTKGGIMAERLMLELVGKGMSRQEAHETVRKLAIEAREKNKHLKELAKEKIKQLSEKEIENIFDVASYIGEAEKIVDEALDS